MPQPLSREAFAAELNVSRETLERLDLYLFLLQRWNKAINLVGRATLSDPWRRHVLDSAQVLALLPAAAPDRARVLVDLGSGAGFPGLVLAVMGAGAVHLVESDQRKAAFLRTVARETGTRVMLHNERIEVLEPFPADVVTARALAPLPALLDFAVPFLGERGRAFFLKGREGEQELTAAAAEWKMKVQRHSSRSSEDGVILEIKDLQRAH